MNMVEGNGVSNQSHSRDREQAVTGEKTSPATVMVVEDAPIIRQPIEAALNRAGYDTVVAEHGVEAIDLLRQRIPDLILLDLAMPVMDGLGFLRAIRAEESWRDIPVIVLSAIAEKPRVIEAVKLGIVAYLLKSRFSLQEMLDLIDKNLNENPAQRGNATVGETMQSQDCASVESPAPPTQTHESDNQAPFARVELPSISAETDPMDMLRAIKPMMTRSEITARIESADELKGMSPAVAQVLKLTGNARCSLEHVAKAISQDHAIALKVLKLANSVVYTRGEPVDSVQLAVSRIGLGQIRQTVLNLSVMERFSSATLAGGINFGQFWEHAIAVGLIAAELTRARNEKEIDTAFTMGLLHDVGRLFFADQLGEIYAEVLRVAESLKLPIEFVESRLLLFNHADVMDRLLHQWKFPKQLINPIVFHHLSAGNIRRNAPKQLEEVATLGLANRLAHAMMLGSSGNESIYPTEDLWEMLKLDPAVIDVIHASTREEADKIKFALLATSDTGNWEQLREAHRGELAVPILPLFVSATPRIDGYRIFCEELKSAFDEAEQLPNLGVIHFTHTRDRVSMTSEYRKREAAEGVSNLPLLVLSPAGKIMPENSLVNGRAIESLSTPFTIRRFIEACNRLLGGAVQSHAA